MQHVQQHSSEILQMWAAAISTLLLLGYLIIRNHRRKNDSKPRSTECE